MASNRSLVRHLYPQALTAGCAGRRLRVGAMGGVVLLLALPALWPLLGGGFFVSDDGRFHVYRIAALAQAWAQGALHPRLFPDFGFGYGQAVLNFYAPLSYWPGALLALLGTGPALAAKLTIALAFLLAALAAYGFGASLWGPAGGLLAAVVYTYFPYHLADAYLRGALPEHFAFIWPPLILWAYTVAFRTQRPLAPLLWSSLAWAALVLTHNLTALLMAPVAALYLVVLAATSGRWRRLLPAAGSLALALGLSAAYWLSVLAESGAVGIGLGPSDGYQKHLAALGQLIQASPLYHYRVEGGADYPLNWLAALALLAVAGAAGWQAARHRRVPGAAVLGFSLFVALGAIFMTSGASLPIWRPLAPVLGHLQYPWRFLGMAALGLAGAAAALPSLLAGGGRRSLIVAALIGLGFMVSALPYLPAQPLALPDADAWAPDRMWREDAAAGQVGATWTGEFLPLTVKEQRWALGRPLAHPADGPALPATAMRITALSYDRIEAQVSLAAPAALRLHQFWLPGWTARVDGRTTAAYPSGEMGLVTVDVPAGEHRLAFSFGSTPARRAGAILSTLAAGVWAALAFGKRRAQTLRLAGVGLLLLALALDLNALGVGRRAWTPRPAAARLGDVALLIGYDVAPARSAQAVDVTLYWLALRDTATDYKVFVHLLDASGQVIAQQDGDPVGGFTPTTRWRAGEIIADRHRLPLPTVLPAGDYGLKAGMYQNPPLHNLPVTPPTADGRVDLSTVSLPKP